MLIGRPTSTRHVLRYACLAVVGLGCARTPVSPSPSSETTLELEVRQVVLPVLAGALDDPDPDVRRATVWALHRAGPEGFALLSEADWEATHPLTYRARHARTPREVEAELLSLLRQDDDREATLVAEQAFEAIGPPCAAALTELLADGGAPTAARQRAALTIAKLGPQADIALPVILDILADPHEDPTVHHAALRCTRPFGAAVVPVVVRWLEHEDPTVRWNAVQVLGHVGPAVRPALPALLAALNEGRIQPSAFMHCVEGASPADSEVIQVLIAFLDTPDTASAAAWVLAQIGDESGRTIQALSARLGDDRPAPDYSIGYWAARALLDIGPRGQAVLQATLEDGTPPARAAVVRALRTSSRLPSPAREARAAILQDRVDAERRGERRRPIPELDATHLRGPEGEAAVRALAERARAPWSQDSERLTELGPAAYAALPMWRAALRDPRPALRHQAIACLTSLGPAAAPALPEVLALLAERRDNPPEQCFYLIAAMGPAAREAIPTLMRFLTDEDLPPDKVDGIRWATADALGGIGADALPVVAPLLCDSRRDMRLYAVAILADIGVASRPYEADVLGLTYDPDPEVSRGAVRALVGMRAEAPESLGRVFEAIQQPGGVQRLTMTLAYSDDESGIPYLLHGLDSEIPCAQAYAAAVLGNLIHHRRVERDSHRDTVPPSLLSPSDIKVLVPRLVAIACGNDAAAALTALSVLGTLETEVASDTIEILRTARRDVRVQAAQLLSRTVTDRWDEALPALAEAATDPAAEVRRAAIYSLPRAAERALAIEQHGT